MPKKLWLVGAYVYVIGPESGPFKVGWSLDPARRREALQGAQFDRLHLHAMVWFYSSSDARSVERAAHRILREKQRHGEWFDVRLDEAIAAIAEAARRALQYTPKAGHFFDRREAERAYDELAIAKNLSRHTAQ